MPINPDALMAEVLSDIEVIYDERDVMLYALGIGFGSDPDAAREMPFVTEHRGLRTLPTLASMIIPDSLLAKSGCDLRQVLHRGQSLDIFRPLPAAARMMANQRVVSVADRGKDQGAEIELETELRLKRDGAVVCVLGSRLIARADGGFGGAGAVARQRHKMPEREPDLTCDLPTRVDQALLFRLCGDFNPLHSDPVAAASAGFEAPILHGRCTYGIACRAILKTVCDYDFTLITGFDVRFSAPVYPGEIITTEMWQDGNIVSFRCKVKKRAVTVINDGKCTLAA